jgi:hypothetical protein
MWMSGGLILLATVLLIGILLLGAMAFHGMTAFDIQYHDLYFVVQTHQALVLLLVVELLAVAMLVYLRQRA